MMPAKYTDEIEKFILYLVGIFISRGTGKGALFICSEFQNRAYFSFLTY